MHVHRTRMVVVDSGWNGSILWSFFFFSFLEDEKKRSEPLLLSLYCRYVGMMMVEKAERDNNRQYNNAHIVVIHMCIVLCALYNMQWSHPQRAHQMFTRNNVVLFYCPCLQLLSLAWLLAFLILSSRYSTSFLFCCFKRSWTTERKSSASSSFSLFGSCCFLARILCVFVRGRQKAIHSVVMYVFILWLTYLPIHHHHCCCDHDHHCDIISFLHSYSVACICIYTVTVMRYSIVLLCLYSACA